MPTVATTTKVIRSADAKATLVGSLGCRFLLDASTTDAVSVVAHTLAGHRLGAPLHRHSREDEFSVVTSGTVTAMLGDDIVTAEPGDLVVKPRGQWHTFWNATDQEATLLEIIAPGGFERYFAEFGALLQASGGNPPADAVGTITARFGLDLRLESIPELCQEYGLSL